MWTKSKRIQFLVVVKLSICEPGAVLTTLLTLSTWPVNLPKLASKLAWKMPRDWVPIYGYWTVVRWKIQPKITSKMRFKRPNQPKYQSWWLAAYHKAHRRTSLSRDCRPLAFSKLIEWLKLSRKPSRVTPLKSWGQRYSLFLYFIWPLLEIWRKKSRWCWLESAQNSTKSVHWSHIDQYWLSQQLYILQDQIRTRRFGFLSNRANKRTSDSGVQRRCNRNLAHQRGHRSAVRLEITES